MIAWLRGRSQRLWLVMGAGGLLLLAGLLALMLGGESPGSDHGERLALYGLQQREKADKAGEVENEAGQRKGSESFGREENEEAEREHEESGEEPSTREAAGIVEGREGGEGERHGART